MSTYTQLTQEQRYQIYALKKAGHFQIEIARTVGVPWIQFVSTNKTRPSDKVSSNDKPYIPFLLAPGVSRLTARDTRPPCWDGR
uniref:Helix-turn-helix domain-containing protein n=1 Tax=Candidatus Kentrum sp. FW TaxID=2126338 RepID=A0A450U3E8_9GAMM|nr:MAG: hypothetical protein BECKFW1821C_GA0114237_11332 [Candidatus Kentron sp. FW]